MLFDSLSYVKMMQEAGFNEPQSKALVTVWSKIVELDLVTKKDLEIAFLRERRFHDENFKSLDERFANVDKRFSEVDKRFAEVDKRFGEVDKRFGEVDKRFEAVEARLSCIEETLKHLPGKILIQFTFVAFAMVSAVATLGKMNVF